MNTWETYKLNITNYSRTILIQYTHTHTHVNKIDFMSIWLTNSSLKIKFIKSNQSRKKRVKEIQIKGNKIHLTANKSFSFSLLIIASDFRRKYF